MEFDRKELVDKLNSLRPAIAEQGLIPELSHIWFTGKSVRAFNGGLGIRRPLKLDFECGLPGKMLLDLVGTSSLDKVSLEQSEDNEVLVSMGKSKVKLASMPSDGAVWPFPSKFPKDKTTIKLTAPVLDALDKLKFVKLNKPALVIHNGVLIVPMEGGKGADLFSTDSNSIARVAVNDVKFKERILIDWRFGEQIAKLFNPGVRLLVERDQLVVGGVDGIIMGTNRMEVPDSPDVKATFEKAYQSEKHVAIPKGFATALERAAIIAGTEDPLIAIDVDGKTMVVRASFAHGVLNAKVKLDKSMPPMKRVFTGPLIERGLGLSSKFAVTPGAFCMSGEEGFAYVLSNRDPGAEREIKKGGRKGSGK